MTSSSSVKALFLSDTHVGFARRTRVYPERRQDAIFGMERALEIGKERGVDVYLHGGDLFDTRRPDAILIHEVMDLIRSLPKGSYRVRVYDLKGNPLEERVTDRVPFVAVHGNHDFMEGERNLYTLLSHLPNFIYAHRRKVVIEKDGEQVCVAGMGYVPDKYVLSYIKQYRGISCPSPSYFLFHQPVEGLYPSYTREVLVPPSLFPEGFDLYLGGHLHWIVDKEVNGKRFLIPGSTVITRLKEGEMNQPRIVYIIEGKDVERVEIPGVRRAYRVESSDDVEEIVRKVEEVLRGHTGPTPLVKVVLVGERRGVMSEESLRKAFKGRAMVYLFDRREDAFVERLREIRSSVDAEAFSEDAFVEELKRLMGELWSDEVGRAVKRLLEGKDDEALDILLNGSEKGAKKGTITEWLE